MPLNDPSPPTSLFYFTALNIEDRKLWTQQTLLDNTVYFRSREQLNDPNELRPLIVAKGTDKELRRFARQLILERWPTKLSPAKRLHEENKLMHRYRNTPLWVEQMLHQVLDRVGVFCVSESATEPLLWAHYADGHRGIVIEFDAHAGLFAAAQRVIYTDEVPVINRLIDDPKEILEKCMLTKGIAWAYEREWRVIARWGDEARIAQYFSQHRVPAALESFIRVQHGPGHYALAPEAIRGVILGSRVSSENEAWLQSVLDRIPREIPIRRASIARSGVVTLESMAGSRRTTA